MFKIHEVAPEIAARVDAYERARAEHTASCTADLCDRCGRRAPRPSDDPAWLSRSLLESSRDRALEMLPAAFEGATLDAAWLAILVGPPTVEQAKQSITAPRAVFVGAPGSGKTSLAVAMFRAAVAAETRHAVSRFRYYSAHQLAKARAGHPLGDGEAPVVTAALAAPLLVLDELGGEDARHASAVAEVLYERHAEQSPTWITTGIGPTEVANRYGGGIARRVFEDSVVFRLARRK